jgi:hypothetical protein
MPQRTSGILYQKASCLLPVETGPPANSRRHKHFLIFLLHSEP